MEGEPLQSRAGQRTQSFSFLRLNSLAGPGGKFKFAPPAYTNILRLLVFFRIRPFPE